MQSEAGVTAEKDIFLWCLCNGGIEIDIANPKSTKIGLSNWGDDTAVAYQFRSPCAKW